VKKLEDWMISKNSQLNIFSLVEELISLSNTISKIFEWKIKTREYKSK